MKKIFFNILLLLICGHSFGQDFKTEILKNDVQIYTSVQRNNHTPSSPGISYSFDNDGNIQGIYNSDLLNPVYSKKDNFYCAKYEYTKGGELSKEQIYESGDGEYFNLFRVTEYTRQSDCVTVIAKQFDDSRTVGIVKECKENGLVLKKVIELDTILGKRSSANNSIVDYTYKEGKLVNLRMSSKDRKHEVDMKFEHSNNKLMIGFSSTIDTIIVKDKQSRFFDKKGRLIKISVGDKRKEWYVKICYGKNGIIDKIIRRARTHKTNEKVKSTILFNTIFLDESKKNKINTSKINDEIINMYYPVVGMGLYINYSDSRRFIMNHG